MKSFITPRLAFLAIIIIVATSVVMGYPLIPHEALAGLGVLPFAFTGETALSEIADLVKKQNDGLESWQKKYDEKFKTLDDEFLEFAKKSNRPIMGEIPTADTKGEVWVDIKSRDKINVLTHGQPLATTKQGTSLGRFLRGIALGSAAEDAEELRAERKALGLSPDPSGGYTVAGAMSSEWIDLLRSQMVLSQAGARTVPMNSGELSIARVTGDPVVSWHGENMDIPNAEPTFGQITLYAKTVVCLVKMSLELSQDSANIEQILQSTVVNAMASAIDTAGLLGVTANAGAAPSGVINLTDRKKVLSIGASSNLDFIADGMYELMLSNIPVESIGAMVAHPALWRKIAKLKDADGNPMKIVDDVAKLRKLWTTAAPLTGGNTATAIIADWRDLLFGVRKNIQVQVLRDTFLGTNLQIAILAYARVDFAATRHHSFCTLEGITV